MMELFDKIAVVTQAASEVGQIASDVLFEAGASVYLADAHEVPGREAAERLLARKHWLQNCEFVLMDAGDPLSIGELNSQLTDKWGGVDIVVNILGTAPAGAGAPSNRLPSAELPEACFESFAAAARAFLPSMKRNGSGRIINVAGFGVAADRAGPSAHARDNDPAVALTRELAEEAMLCGVNVNCLWAGRARLSLPAEDERSATPPLIGNEDRREIEEIVLFFSSPASKHLTGQVLELNTALAGVH